MLDPKHGKVRSRSDCGADQVVDVLDARPIRVGLLRQPVQRVIHLLDGLILAVGLAGQVVLGVAAVLSDVVGRTGDGGQAVGNMVRAGGRLDVVIRNRRRAAAKYVSVDNSRYNGPDGRSKK